MMYKDGHKGAARSGCIYKELHNHGRRSSGRSDGNACSYHRVKGVGMVRVSGYRWVGEMTVNRKRYRCRSTDRSRVEAWLSDMREKFGD